MLTVKNDLTDSSYTRSDLCVFCIYSATSAFNEEHQCHHKFDTHDLISVFRMVYIISFLKTRSLMFLTRGWTSLKETSSVSWFVSEVACDHVLSLYLCNLFSGGGHDTFLLQITCKKPESGLFSDWIGNYG